MNELHDKAQSIRKHLLSAAENIIAVGLDPYAKSIPGLDKHIAAAKIFKQATPDNALAIVEFIMGESQCLN